MNSSFPMSPSTNILLSSIGKYLCEDFQEYLNAHTFYSPTPTLSQKLLWTCNSILGYGPPTPRI